MIVRVNSDDCEPPQSSTTIIDSNPQQLMIVKKLQSSTAIDELMLVEVHNQQFWYVGEFWQLDGRRARQVQANANHWKSFMIVEFGIPKQADWIDWRCASTKDCMQGLEEKAYQLG